MTFLLSSSVTSVLRGVFRSPPIGKNRNKGQPRRWNKSNKGMQHWNKGKGVGLQGQLTKKGRFLANIKTKEASNLLIPDLKNFLLRPYAYIRPTVLKSAAKSTDPGKVGDKL